MKNKYTAKETDSMPTETVAVESKNNNRLGLISDATDARGVRHVEIRTTAIGNIHEAYAAAERQGHSWFFANYDPIIPGLDAEKYTELALTTTELGLSTGRLSKGRLDCPHPRIQYRQRKFMFGHSCANKPTATEATWCFQFEILSMGASN
jgi:hypothetical protein